MKVINLDTVVIGSGLSGLSFINEFLKKNKKISLISPIKPASQINDVDKEMVKNLPPQIFQRKSISSIINYLKRNEFSTTSDAEVIGSLEFGGLSNYWANQIEIDELGDLEGLKKNEKIKLKKILMNLIKKNKFIINSKDNVNHKLKVDETFTNLFEDVGNLKITKPNLALTPKKKQIEFKNDFTKFNARNFFSKIKNKKNLKIYDCYLIKIKKNGLKYSLICRSQKNNKVINFNANKVIMACGTLVTTKLLIDYLDIKSEVVIKHHQRLISSFLAKNTYHSNMNFLNSIIWFKGKIENKNFIGDLRIGSKIIIDAIVRKFPFLSIFRIFLDQIRKKLFFSNIFLSTSYSNLYLLKKNEKYIIYTKSNKQARVNKILVKCLNKLKSKLSEFNLIYPISIIKPLKPGNDFHYCGTLKFNKPNYKLSIDNNCQLNKNKNLYVVDSSVFDFKKNLFPLAIVISNSIRVANNLLKK